MDVKSELLYILVGLVGGPLGGIFFYAAEALGFWVFRFLEGRGLVRRWVPGSKLQENHPGDNAWNVGFPYIPLYYLVARNWRAFYASMDFDCNPVRIWLLLWCGMAAHDLWFFLMHSFFHKVKPVFRSVHAAHHTNGSNVTAFGTSFGDAADIGLCIVLYHAFYLMWLRAQPRWSVVAVAMYILQEIVTNIYGHCGYAVPLWLHVVMTGGVGLTPLAATSKIHYIHHLDSRYNRALYFTWWDRLAGTHRNTHAFIKD